MQFDIGKAIDKFKYNPDSVKKKYDGKTDIYLAKVSYRFAYLKRIFYVLFVLVLIAFVLSGNISYNKIYYLTKDITLASDYVNSKHDTVTYNVGNSQSFVPYRSGIAVASRERLSLFSAGGRELFASTHSYANPTLASGNKYVLLYDVGGKQFSLYNSFSKIRETSLDYTIYGACIANNGSFAIITRSEKYEQVVSVYTQNENRYDYNFSSGRVVAVSLSKSGNQLAVVLVFSDVSGLRSELRLYKVGEGASHKANITFAGIPFDVRFFDNGNVVTLGAKGVNVYNGNLSLVGEYLTEKEIYAYDIGEDNIAIVHATENAAQTQAVILNKRGRAEKKITFEERVMDVLLYRGYLYTQTLGGFVRTNISLNKSTKIGIVANDFKMISADRDTLIVCNSSYAKFLYFK